jgi:tetratricopeptide (TPR) repeat protein
MAVRLTFSAETEASRAYETVLQLGNTPASLDTGCHRVSYSFRKDGDSPGRRDGKVDVCETWNEFAAQAHRFPAATWSSRQADLGAPSLFDSPPWVIPANPSPRFQPLLKRIDGEIRRLGALHKNARDRDLRIAQGLYHFVVSPAGLGLRFADSLQTRSVEEVLWRFSQPGRKSTASCSECVSVLCAVFQRASVLLRRPDLKVVPVFVFETAAGVSLAEGTRTGHVATAFRYAGRKYLMDPKYDGFDVPHRNAVPLSLREFWAWNLNNRAILAAEAENWARAQSLFRLAEELDPNNPHIVYNLGVKLDAAGREPEAKAAFQRVRRVDRRFLESYPMLQGALLEP